GSWVPNNGAVDGPKQLAGSCPRPCMPPQRERSLENWQYTGINAPTKPLRQAINCSGTAKAQVLIPSRNDCGQSGVARTRIGQTFAWNGSRASGCTPLRESIGEACRNAV